MKRRIVGAVVLGLGLVGLALRTSDSTPGADARAVPVQADTRDARSTPAVSTFRGAGASQTLAPVAMYEPYQRDQYMVRFESGSDAAAIVAAVGGRLERSVGRSGYAWVDLSGATDPTQALADLFDEPGVQGGTPMASTSGASVPNTQWHLRDLWFASLGRDVSDIVVAVVDTGVAYESAYRDGQSYVQAGSLAGRFVAPYDFVNDDPYPNDDHGHGTHIASLIASDGTAHGVARRATLMPVKVLDHNNTGSEYSLIEGIFWAIDHGADVVNLSLTMHPDYVPSRALLEALTAAHDAGVVVVAASGNDGLQQVSWPARHPSVLAVAASHSPLYHWQDEPAPYTNLGPEVDLMTHGGDLGRNLHRTGIADGMLAETLRPGDPSTTQFRFMAGTSQAAAVVSGMVAQMLNRGLPAHEVASRLRQGSVRSQRWDPDAGVYAGTGSGPLQTFPPLTLSSSSLYTDSTHVGLLPWLAKYGDWVCPVLEVVAVDSDGRPIVDAQVVATVKSRTETETASCQSDDAGTCSIWSGCERGDQARAYQFTVGALVHSSGHISHPSPMVYETTASAALVEGAQDPIAYHWTQGWVDDLGPVAESVSIVASAEGVIAPPTGVVFNMVDTAVTSEETEWLNVGGSVVEVNRGWIDGTGLASLPVGMGVFQPRFRRLAWIDGTGLASMPIGLGLRPTSRHLFGRTRDMVIPGELYSGASMGWTDLGYDAVGTAVGAGLFEATETDQAPMQSILYR